MVGHISARIRLRSLAYSLAINDGQLPPKLRGITPGELESDKAQRINSGAYQP